MQCSITIVCDYLEICDNKLNQFDIVVGCLIKSYSTVSDGVGYHTKQPMGCNLLERCTVKMMQFLQLEKSKTYTGHVMCRSTTNTLAK